jgi:16S rRNA processing protein RimM
MNPEKVVLAEIVRVRGIRGELVARSQTDIPGRLATLKQALVELPDGSDVEVTITSAWEHKGDWVIKLAGIDTIEAAERLRGGDLWVKQADRASLAEGEFFQSDLTGCQLIDSRTGDPVGIVEGWQEYGGPPLMEVRNGEREHLVPFVGPLCEVDLQAKTIRTELPEGLLEL